MKWIRRCVLPSGSRVLSPGQRPTALNFFPYFAVHGAQLAQRQQLVAISNILKRNNTNFQLVISPLYHQEKLNPVDFSILQHTFGTAHVHDFSGLNEFTIPVGNYYEENHYRPIVGRKILRVIYASTL